MSFQQRIKTPVATVIVDINGNGDTTDIQTGINLLPVTGGVVYIKEGTYNLTAGLTITSNDVALIGAGRSTVIQTTANVPLITITGEGCIIEKLYVYGSNAGAAQVGITLSGSVWTTVSGCWIDNCGSHAVSVIATSNDCMVKSCYLNDNNGNGLYVNNSNQIRIRDNFVVNNDLIGIELVNEVENCTITGNHILFHSGNAIRVTDTSPTFSGGNILSNNYIYLNGGIGVLVNSGGAGTVINDNLIFASGNDGIKMLAFGSTINSNTIQSSSAGGHGIWISGASSIVVIGNELGGNGGSGIYLDGNSDNNVLNSNRCYWNLSYGINISVNTCDKNIISGNQCLDNTTGAINDAGTNTHPNGASGTNNLELDDLNIIA